MFFINTINFLLVANPSIVTEAVFTSHTGRFVMMQTDQEYLSAAIELAKENVRRGGRPFAAIIVKNGEILAQEVNQMLEQNDPTAHAELLALRAAGKKLSATDLAGVTVYASGQPCPMCLAACRMSGVGKVIFAYSNQQAEAYGLSTAHIAKELAQPLEQQAWLTIKHLSPEDDDLYQQWKATTQSIGNK